MPSPEPNRLLIRFLGEPMAELAQAGNPPEYALAFTPEFLKTGHDLSPLNLPSQSLGAEALIYREGTTPFPGGLPGLLADSLPDSWGAKLRRIAHPGLTTLLGKFAAVGSRGPGALTFEPVLESEETTERVRLATLAEEANRIFKIPEILTAQEVDRQLAKAGSSLGGAHPKTTAYLPEKAGIIALSDILLGGTPPAGAWPCILKFSPEDDEGGGAVEYAFALMAQRAGVEMAPCYLVHDGQRRHFATARFDRLRGGDGMFARRHVHTLSGMLHKRASDGQIDYEEFMRLSRTLAGAPAAEECLRRGVFNLLATNRDDHGRNHAFLYDEASRRWALSPAYDLNPSVFTVPAGLAWLGRLEIPTRFETIERLAEIGGVSQGRTREVFDEVEAAVGEWPAIAKQVEVPKAIVETWHKEMNVQTRQLRSDRRQNGTKRRRST
jgi:serine/threonine-protein kinase HipA